MVIVFTNLLILFTTLFLLLFVTVTVSSLVDVPRSTRQRKKLKARAGFYRTVEITVLIAKNNCEEK